MTPTYRIPQTFPRQSIEASTHVDYAGALWMTRQWVAN